MLFSRSLRWKSLVTGVCAVGCILTSQAAPSVLLTNVPAYGTFDPLQGLVVNADPACWNIAVFIYVPGAGWYSKPYCNPQLTPIGPDGSWSANVTTGGSDQLATRLAALLVRTNYGEPCVLGASNLPTNVFAQATATAVVTRQYPGPRWVSFSGYDWWVKASSSPVGPGPNYFSDSTNNVWVDATCQLHVRITNRSNQWQCAELVSARTFGYGSYRFELASRADNLDPNVVLGLFTWSDDPVYADREIDVECSRFGNATDPNNAQYVVQPYNLPGHLVRFAAPTGATNVTHVFTWETNRVSFQSQVGSYQASPSGQNLISNWTYSLTVPQTGDENVRINLWLLNGAPPTNNQEVEIILKKFEFVPLGAPRPARLSNGNRLPDGEFHFFINGDPDRRYTVQGSTNLLDWESLSTLLATNIILDFLDPTSVGIDQRFFRTATEP